MMGVEQLGRFSLRLLAGWRMLGRDGCDWFVCFLCCPFDQSQCPKCCLPYCDPGDSVQAEGDLSPSAAGASELLEEAQLDPEEAA